MDHSVDRNGRSGVILLATLLSVLLLASLAALLQARTTASLRALARLERAHEEAVAIDAAREELRSVIFALLQGRELGDPKPNLAGRVFETRGGMAVQVQDVDGLVDLYLAPAHLLGALGLDPAARQRMIDGLPPGERYPTVGAALARMGLTGEEAFRLMPLLTQRGSNGQVRVETLGPGLEGLASVLTPLDLKFGGVERVGIRITGP